MRTVIEHYDLVVAGLGALVSAAWLGYKVGQWRSTARIAERLRTDRDFSVVLVEELAGRWGVKIERQETPGAP